MDNIVEKQRDDLKKYQEELYSLINEIKAGNLFHKLLICYFVGNKEGSILTEEKLLKILEKINKLEPNLFEKININKYDNHAIFSFDDYFFLDNFLQKRELKDRKLNKAKFFTNSFIESLETVTFNYQFFNKIFYGLMSYTLYLESLLSLKNKNFPKDNIENEINEFVFGSFNSFVERDLKEIREKDPVRYKSIMEQRKKEQTKNTQNFEKIEQLQEEQQKINQSLPEIEKLNISLNKSQLPIKLNNLEQGREIKKDSLKEIQKLTKNFAKKVSLNNVVSINKPKSLDSNNGKNSGNNFILIIGMLLVSITFIGIYIYLEKTNN